MEVGLRLFCPLPIFKHVLEKWHPIIYNNFCYSIVTLKRLSFSFIDDDKSKLVEMKNECGYKKMEHR